MGENNVSKFPRGEYIVSIENVCVRKLAQNIVIMKNRLRNTALILILTVICVHLGPQCAISSCSRNL